MARFSNSLTKTRTGISVFTTSGRHYMYDSKLHIIMPICGIHYALCAHTPVSQSIYQCVVALSPAQGSRFFTALGINTLLYDTV